MHTNFLPTLKNSVRVRVRVKQSEGECDYIRILTFVDYARNDRYIHSHTQTQTHTGFRSPCSAPRRNTRFGMKICFPKTRSPKKQGEREGETE